LRDALWRACADLAIDESEEIRIAIRYWLDEYERHPETIQRAADAHQTNVAAWITESLGRGLAEAGISLPPDCPEYQPDEAPEATLNELLEREATALLPMAKAKVRPWAEATVRGEWDAIRKALIEIDDPALWNDFIQSWSIPGRTARQKLHALKFRLQAYQGRMPISKA